MDMNKSISLPCYMEENGENKQYSKKYKKIELTLLPNTLYKILYIKITMANTLL